jgi:rubrerythrin
VLTRREALLTAATGLVVAGCGGRPARKLAGDPSDIRILAAALEEERKQVALFSAGLELTDAPIVRTIFEHQRAHVSAIEEAIRELGGTPAAARPIAAYALNKGRDAWKQDAINAEERWSAGYAAVIPKLANPRLRSTFGALATSEAEHAVALDVA